MNAVAVLRIPDENRALREHDEVHDYLAGIGIDYERWEAAADLASDATAEQVLTVYSQQIEELKRRGGYVTPDVIAAHPHTPGLGARLSKINIQSPHPQDAVPY